MSSYIVAYLSVQSTQQVEEQHADNGNTIKKSKS